MTNKPEKVPPIASSSDCFNITPESRHPDRIISRLRLFDGFGNPITNPKLLFRDCEVVGFFFATIWHPQKEQFHNDVLDFSQRHPHRFKCIYVSIDSKKQDFELATKEKAWVHMAWDDGSNLENEEQETEPPSTDFITPDETTLLGQIFAGSLSMESDPRPISRVSLVQQLNVLSVPTLSTYHLQKGTWLDSNVRASLFETKEQRDRAWETWQKSERLEMSWADIFQTMRWSIFLLIAGIIYTILVKFDDSYNIVHLTEYFMNPGSRTGFSTQEEAIPSIPKAPAHYAEF
ncbi:hypothetical protein CROQUDRAFT_656080 [Cronartium quercuum f. sp. fusiforme G11]|uniref:Thioredoxin-like fold domain-containing protein n=1 Tax=Cronartium quercuum f. sp. fusiforme G11 TaxID=708437 RepID=A0A9P6NQ27_9BASI|nr:hypothetical protein CROQUDRAFT_656080 [Cronartium quercuum f. sp. fusiforme G11]